MSSHSVLTRSGIAVALAMLLLAPLIFSSTTIYPFITSKAFVIHIGVILLGCLWIHRLWLDDDTVKTSLLGLLLVALCLFYAVAGYLGENIQRSFLSTYERSQGVLGMFYWLLLALVSVRLLPREEDWQWLFRWILTAGCVAVVPALMYQVGLFDAPYFYRDFGRLAFTVGNSAIFGNYLAVVASLGCAMFMMGFTTADRRTNWVRAAQIGLLVVGLIATGSRSGFLALAVTMFLLLWFAPLSVRVKTTLALGAGGLLLGSMLLLWDTVSDRVADTLVANQSIVYRYEAWQIGWAAFLDKPWLGYGPENFLAIFGAYSDANQITHETFDTAHNHLLAIVLDAGLPGLVLYLTILAYISGILFRVYQTGEQDKKSNVMVVAAVLLSYQIAALFLFESLITAPLFFLVMAYCLRYSKVLFVVPKLAIKPTLLTLAVVLTALGVHEMRVLNNATRLLTLQAHPDWREKLQVAGEFVDERFRREEVLQLLAHKIWSEWQSMPRTERPKAKASLEAYIAAEGLVNLNWRTLLHLSRAYIVFVQAGADSHNELKLLVDRTMQLAPHRPQSHRLLANYYLVTGQPAAAKQVLEAYLARNPDRPVMKGMLEKL
jgi:O-antigen ligase